MNFCMPNYDLFVNVCILMGGGLAVWRCEGFDQANLLGPPVILALLWACQIMLKITCHFQHPTTTTTTTSFITKQKKEKKLNFNMALKCPKTFQPQMQVTRFTVTCILHTARISNVERSLQDDRYKRKLVNFRQKENCHILYITSVGQRKNLRQGLRLIISLVTTFPLFS